MEIRMLTNQQIEDQDYSLADVADLKMRLDYALQQFALITNTYHGINGVKKTDCIQAIYSTAEESIIRIRADHKKGCMGAELSGIGVYKCTCGEVA